MMVPVNRHRVIHEVPRKGSLKIGGPDCTLRQLTFVQTHSSGHWIFDELPAAVQAIEHLLSHPEHLPFEFTTDGAAI